MTRPNVEPPFLPVTPRKQTPDNRRRDKHCRGKQVTVGFFKFDSLGRGLEWHGIVLFASVSALIKLSPLIINYNK